MDWNDLRYVLAVGTAGTLAGAARTLGVNHTTVLRRIAGLEEKSGVRLFERLPGGYVPTEAGEALLETARRIDIAVVDLERRMAGEDLRLSGGLRVTTTDTLMASILPPILAAFHAAYPGIVVEVAVTNTVLSLTRRDADVAIRPADDPLPALVGRRVASIGFAVYGTSDCLKQKDRAWLAPDDSLAGTLAARWMREEFPDAAVVARASSLLALRELAAAGLGLAVLPRYLGDPTPGLVRLNSPSITATSGLWVLTHEDLRRTARVRAFTEFVSQAFTRQRKLLQG